MLVNIESPFASHKPWFFQRIYERWLNRRYARACLLDSLRRGEFPIASHLLYTQVLDDGDKEQRSWGIQAGLAWNRYAQLTVVYFDRGISKGMEFGIEHAHEHGRQVIYRSLYGDDFQAQTQMDKVLHDSN